LWPYREREKTDDPVLSLRASMIIIAFFCHGGGVFRFVVRVGRNYLAMDLFRRRHRLCWYTWRRFAPPSVRPFKYVRSLKMRRRKQGMKAQ
jgi:hypothetical protein